MARMGRYTAEFTLLGLTMVIGLLGFWDIYLGADARPQPHHHLHLAVTYLWMALLLAQLVLLVRGDRSLHRSFGLAVLVAGPLLVAMAAFLTVHSAHRAIESGQDDFLIVQNIVGTIWLGLMLSLAFIFKKRRRLHGACLFSTLILFLGPALFFVLIIWAPPFRIEGPDTFYRFGMAAMTGQAIVLGIALLLLLKDRRNNWPYLLAAASFAIAEGVKAWLTAAGLIDPLTRTAAVPDQTATFALAFAITAALLAFPVLASRANGASGRAPSKPRPANPIRP